MWISLWLAYKISNSINGFGHLVQICQPCGISSSLSWLRTLSRHLVKRGPSFGLKWCRFNFCFQVQCWISSGRATECVDPSFTHRTSLIIDLFQAISEGKACFTQAVLKQIGITAASFAYVIKSIVTQCSRIHGLLKIPGNSFISAQVL